MPDRLAATRADSYLPMALALDQDALIEVLGGTGLVEAATYLSILAGTVLGGRFARHLDYETRRWLTVALGTEVVVWHTDALNAHSRAAIEKLGAHHDGVLRHHKRRPDGTVRDTACFSLLADEWPAARERLEGRVTTALHP